MAKSYRLVGSQAPDSRIDRVLVESSSEEYPGGKYLVKNGEPVELNDDQVAKLGAFVRLEAVKSDSEATVQLVDQPFVERESTSTDVPPRLGTTPDVNTLNKDELELEVARERASNPDAFASLSARPSKEELQKALRKHYGQEA